MTAINPQPAEALALFQHFATNALLLARLGDRFPDEATPKLARKFSRRALAAAHRAMQAPAAPPPPVIPDDQPEPISEPEQPPPVELAAGFIDAHKFLAGNRPDLTLQSLRVARQAFEIYFIGRALRRAGGNIAQTARQIGMDATALHRKLRLLGITTKPRPRPKQKVV